MKSLLMTTAVILAANSAFAYEPAVQRQFSDITSSGCNNRDGNFIVRGMASAERLNELRETRSPVLATLECKGDGTPIAVNLSYENSDGTQGSISF